MGFLGQTSGCLGWERSLGTRQGSGRGVGEQPMQTAPPVTQQQNSAEVRQTLNQVMGSGALKPPEAAYPYSPGHNWTTFFALLDHPPTHGVT